MKKHKIKYLTMLIGSILAAAIVCAQLFSYHSQTTKNHEVAATQEAGQQEERAVISLPSFSLPAPIHVTLGLDSYCLFEILFEDQRPEASESESAIRPQKLLMTLFRVIISPNAP